MRKREGTWKKKTVNISEEVIEKLREGCLYRGMKESHYVEFLINQEAESIDPIEKLNSLRKKIVELKIELNQFEEQYEKTANDLSKHQKWLKEKQKQKPQAILILTRKILEREDGEAEKLAKHWSRRLGIPPHQLISEALDKIKGGI